MKIMVIGDSHSREGWKDLRLPEVVVQIHYLGPKLMFSFGRDKWILLDKKFNADVVVFCFGEIDVRNRIHEYDFCYEQVITDMVNAYMEAVELNVRPFPFLKTYIHFVPPAIKKDESYFTTEETTIVPGRFPFRGSNEDRRKYAFYINERLRAACLLHGFVFIDLYDRYCDSEGFFNERMSDGSVHIKDISPLVVFLSDELGLNEVK